MRMLLGVSVESDNQLKELRVTVGRAEKYFDEVIVLLEGSPKADQSLGTEGADWCGEIISWCEKKKYDYMQYREDEAGAYEKLASRLGLEGAEFMLWLDAGDTETPIEKTIIENMQKSTFKPRVWGEKEICYYANFGSRAIEYWSPKRLKTGLGGSETAVVELSCEWVKLGYEVTVYGDPGEERGVHEGVRYLPWYEWSIHDHFQIFIQWRGVFRSELARYVKARQYYLDMHDMFEESVLSPNVHAIDKVMVKSRFHRELAPKIPDNKFCIIGNGI